MSNELPLHAELLGRQKLCPLALQPPATRPCWALCRELIAAGLDPDQALEVFRGANSRHCGCAR